MGPKIFINKKVKIGKKVEFNVIYLRTLVLWPSSRRDHSQRLDGQLKVLCFHHGHKDDNYVGNGRIQKICRDRSKQQIFFVKNIIFSKNSLNNNNNTYFDGIVTCLNTLIKTLMWRDKEELHNWLGIVDGASGGSLKTTDI